MAAIYSPEKYESEVAKIGQVLHENGFEAIEGESFEGKETNHIVIE